MLLRSGARYDLSQCSFIKSLHEEVEARQEDNEDINLPNQSCLRGTVRFSTISLCFGGPSVSLVLHLLPAIGIGASAS